MRRVRRRSNEKLERCHVQLYEGDFARLAELIPNVAPGYVIRQLVRGTIRKTEAQLEAARQNSKDLSNDLNQLDLPNLSASGGDSEES